MVKLENCILVIFGASGDLTRRKLVPGLFNLYQKDMLPEKFAVLGVSRTKMTDATFRKSLAEGVEDAEEKLHPEDFRKFAKALYYQSIDPGESRDYAKLAKRLKKLDESLGTNGNFIYYLSIAPSMYEIIIENLGAAGLQKEKKHDQAYKRIIVEKPFGYDLASGQVLNKKLLKVFREPQIYRIDHYLGKETVQNLLVFRFSNGIFEPLWNRNFVDHVEITAAETVGIGTRGRYYDASGALRDMVQNHLLQILGIIAMEPPPSFDSFSVRNETVKVFQSLKPITESNVEASVVRGQYTKSQINGQIIPGYREEEHVDPFSRTETFVAMKVFIENWRWGGVPFFIRTGKRLPTRVTEVVIHFKSTPHILFQHKGEHVSVPNQLIIRIQPDEGILLNFGMKRPGAGFHVEKVNMDFHYSDLGDTSLADAYERLLLDCIQGDPTLFARGDAVESCWRFVDPILDHWASKPDEAIYGYPAGTWGPRQANALFSQPGMDWHYPCRNLVEDGLFCEL
ncbi:Glucose-6-phosphate 1-dehydrogenase [Nitrospina gracilis 3/211]|uniref:Glucose-6-phosphate 1-dehydrogenase n=1 Tax=Nitrospina gracilis (strain 3/211) TaxID=1266370 RepID=M1Z9U8_NITG3|nr:MULTISPECIES: glucose-6-phosphate dehydrogenase [Nitrospina]MCF8722355.1 glucose-6-phosphate 1-dehydrogenase [Nitrospina sp. Nb-3]CCQ89967.1 Glucose-6-phosphate 1-dehydrogenase [Nitrospina gracilis 3/211]